LQILDISENAIGDSGAEYLADALRENTLSIVDFSFGIEFLLFGLLRR
jgi:hypothetical protein